MAVQETKTKSASDLEPLTVKGYYRWNLMFDLEGPYKQTITEKVYTKVSTKEFRHHLQKESKSHSVNVSASAEYSTVSFSAQASASYTGEFQYHNDFIAELSADTETGESTEVKYEFEIPKGERRRVFYLVYTMPGVEMPLNVFSDAKHPKDTEVEIECKVKVENDTMHCGDILEVDKELWSANGKYRLVMQQDGNLVLYAGPTTDHRASVWSSHTRGKGMTPHRLILQGDGNLVVYDADGVPTWASHTDKTRAIRLILQNDRNLVLYDGKGKALWSTGTHDADD